MKKLLLILLVFGMAYANGAGKSEKGKVFKDFQTAGLKKSLDYDFLRVVKDLRSRDFSKKSFTDKARLTERISVKPSKRNTQNFLAKTNSTLFRPVTIELDHLYDETSRYTYSYDNNGYVTEELIESFYDGEMDWSGKSVYTYDNNGNVLTEIDQYLEDGNWLNSDRYTLTYDAMGHLKTETYEEFYDGSWQKQDKATYTWENGNMVELLEQEWDGGDWLDSFKASASYDNDGNMLQIILSSFDGDTWVTREIQSWTYDENGNELTALWQGSDETGQLQNYTRESMTYDSSNNLVAYIIEFWEDEAWVTYYRVLLTYAENGDVLTEAEDIYDADTGEWQNNGLTSYDYTYDAAGNLTEVVGANTYAESTYHEKELYSYDVNNNCYQAEFYESWYGDTWEDSQGSLWLYYNNNTEVIAEYAHQVVVNYTSSTSINDEVKVPEKIVLNQNYPNPFNPTTTISFSLPAKTNVKLTVYNSLGQKIDEIVKARLNSGIYSYNFAARDLNSGIYFYKLQTDDHQIVKKMVLIK